jgi:hypothetical protein
VITVSPGAFAATTPIALTFQRLLLTTATGPPDVSPWEP